MHCLFSESDSINHSLLREELALPYNLLTSGRCANVAVGDRHVINAVPYTGVRDASREDASSRKVFGRPLVAPTPDHRPLTTDLCPFLTFDYIVQHWSKKVKVKFDYSQIVQKYNRSSLRESCDDLNARKRVRFRIPIAHASSSGEYSKKRLCRSTAAVMRILYPYDQFPKAGFSIRACPRWVSEVIVGLLTLFEQVNPPAFDISVQSHLP